MSEQSVEGRRRIDATLAGLVVSTLFTVAAVVLLLVVIPTGTRALPGTTTGDKREKASVALRSAAIAQVSLLLNQDYHSAQKTLDALIEGSTGELRKAYTAGSVTQVNLAGELKAVAHGKILKVAIMRQGPSSATLIIIADQQIRNTKTTAIKKTVLCAAATLCRYYRFLVTYEQVGGVWKMSAQDYLAS